MTPREARARLLAQHQQLRDLVAVVMALGVRVQADPGAARELQRCLDALRGAFEQHNELELAVLEPLLGGDAAWGPARIARMKEEHAGEHAAITEFLGRPADAVLAGLDDFAEELDAHMAAEERTFLSPAVLGDTPGHAARRNHLRERRRALLVRHQEARELVDEELATREIEASDNAAAQWDAQVISTMAATDRRALAEVTDALNRLDDGSYGRCVACGTQIDEARLAALPEAAFCLGCARRH